MPTTKPNDSRALLGLTWLSPSVLRIRVAGELADDSGPALTAALDASLASVGTRVTICWDLSRLLRWDPRSRREVLCALVQHRTRISEHHVHVRGQPSMDVRSMARALGNMTCYQASSLYDYAVESAIGEQYRECA